MISERQFQDALTQINRAFELATKSIADLRADVDKLKEEVSDLQPKRGKAA